MAIPSGEIYLLNNVPLRADYEHSYDFKDKAEQYSYWSTYIKKTLLNYSYIRKEREYINVEATMEELDDINYMIFRSKTDSRLYYAFVSNKVYVNPSTTSIYFEIDVFQTYMFDYKWQASYIEQAHVDRWTVEHKPIYSKTEEGLDYGNDYSIESGFRITQDKDIKWALVTLRDFSSIQTGESLRIDNSKLTPCPTPFVFFLVPIMDEGVTKPALYRSPKQGAVVKSTLYDKYNRFVDSMLTSAIGDFIQSISLLPYCPLYNTAEVEGQTYYDFGDTLESITFEGDTGMVFERINKLNTSVGSLAITNWDNGIDGSLPTKEQWEEIKSKPRTTKRDKRWESKLLCYPYRYNMLTDWRNTPTIFKNEYMTTDNIEVMFAYTLNQNSPFRFWIKDYKRDPEGRYNSLTQPMALELPVLSDAYATYILENRNTIQTNMSNSLISGISNVVSSAVSGFASGGPIGAGMGAGMSGLGALTNTVTMVRSENAKQRDIANRPDTVINNVDSAFNVVDNNVDISWYRMRICCENEEILASIFNMGGYKVHKVDVPNTRSRVRFNYIQTRGANITGSFNQDDLLKLKSIFDKGITIWHYSKEDFNPLNYDYENIEVNLL